MAEDRPYDKKGHGLGWTQPRVDPTCLGSYHLPPNQAIGPAQVHGMDTSADCPGPCPGPF